MPRRILAPVPIVAAQQIVELDEFQAHHARDVLRLKPGSDIELFDAAGTVADAVITRCESTGVAARVESIRPAAARRAAQMVVGSAVPKGDRADWMIEKLSELGVTRFIPLATARSVVLPQGKSKRDRWQRIAAESAKQSRRAGVMHIDELTPLASLVENLTPSPGTPGDGRGNGVLLRTRRERPLPSPLPEYWHREQPRGIFLSIERAAPSLSSILHPPSSPALFIGPEGGWTDDELAMFRQHGLTAARLTETILRVETAAVAAAAVAAVLLANPP